MRHEIPRKIHDRATHKWLLFHSFFVVRISRVCSLTHFRRKVHIQSEKNMPLLNMLQYILLRADHNVNWVFYRNTINLVIWTQAEFYSLHVYVYVIDGSKWSWASFTYHRSIIEFIDRFDDFRLFATEKWSGTTSIHHNIFEIL